MGLGVQRGRLRLIIANLLVVFLATTAEAKYCGGDVSCDCGDILMGEMTLTQDLMSCPAEGLRLRQSARLDCAGHAIIGVGISTGVVLDRTAGAEVHNCFIAGFRNGIRLRGGAANRIEDNQIVANTRYGVDFSRQTTGNWLNRNLISGSGDEGVHIGTGSDLNFLMFNDILGSGAENVYLLDVRQIIMVANHIAGSGAASVYMKHAQQSVLVFNAIEDRLVHIRGNSAENVFASNFLNGAGFAFEAYRETRPRVHAPLGWAAPTENRIVGGSIQTTGTCVRFSGASGNHVEGVAAVDCISVKKESRGNLQPVGNRLDFI